MNEPVGPIGMLGLLLLGVVAAAQLPRRHEEPVVRVAYCGLSFKVNDFIDTGILGAPSSLPDSFTPPWAIFSSTSSPLVTLPMMV